MKSPSPFFLLALLALPACTRNAGPTSPGNGLSAHIESISGHISNWTHGDQRFISLCFPDSQMMTRISSTSAIDLNGNFTLSNLSAASPHAWGTAPYPTEQLYFNFIENTLTCSDSSVILVPGQMQVSASAPSNLFLEDWLGYVWKATYDTTRAMQPGDYEVSYVYATKDLVLTGTVKTSIRIPTDTTEIRHIMHYDLNFVQGWNQQIRTLLTQRSIQDSSRIVHEAEYSLVGFDPGSAKWIYLGQ